MTEHLPDFGFEAPRRLVVEWGGARRIAEILASHLPVTRVLVVTDAVLHGTGLLDPAKAALQAAGIAVTVFDGVVADPSEDILHDCVAQGRAGGVEAVIGFGGGSSLDIAKLAAVLLHSPQELSALYGIGKVQGGRLPLMQVPTTAGTGSEVTNITILTTGAATKMGVVARQLYADLVLLDAELTLGLPPGQTAATGIDAMVHAIEAYTSRHLKNPMSDLYAREALRLLAPNLVTACRDGSNRPAREAMLLGACLAGMAFANSPVAAVHALAYPLGGRYHLPHGLTNALMLGPVLRHNLRAAAPLYAELGDLLSDDAAARAAPEDMRAADFIRRMEALMDASGAPRRLRDAGVTRESLPQLAADAMLQTRLLGNNPVPVTEADALRLYEAAY